MPRIPHSLGCDACRKRKKKCDEVKPVCGLCARQGRECVGNGVKRTKFQAYEVATTAAPPKKPPSNEVTRTAAAFVHILEITDVRYDIRAFGGKALDDLPAQMGSSRELDATISAAVALYARRPHVHQAEALARYGGALVATRRTLEKHAQLPPMVTLQVLVVMFICQALVDRRHADKHRVMIGHMLRAAVVGGAAARVNPEYLYGLLQIAVWASLMDPSLELGPWFWTALTMCSAPRPVKYHQGLSFHSLEVSTLAQFSICLSDMHNDPDLRIPQLRHTYALIRREKPRMRLHVGLATAATNAPGAPGHAQKIMISYLFSWGVMLAIEMLTAHALRGLAMAQARHDEADELWAAAVAGNEEALELAAQTDRFRPHGAGFLPDVLKAVWAATSDAVVEEGLREEEMRAALEGLEKDVQGADYVNEAVELRERLRLAAERWRGVEAGRLDVVEDPRMRCVIL